jgi:hypothetical protein
MSEDNDKPRSSSPYGFNCRDCFFSSIPHAGSVECRRAAPTPYFEPNGGVSNIRPRVGQYYWCGEYLHWKSPRAQQLIEERSDTATAEHSSASLTQKSQKSETHDE